MANIASGQYFQDTLNGQVFVGSLAYTGLAIPAFSVTAQSFVLWNPFGSGKDVALIKLQIGYVSATATPGNIVYAYGTGLGNTIATGSPITAATFITPVNGYIGGGNQALAKLASAVTFATAPSFYKTSGISQLTTTAANASAPAFSIASDDFNGTVIVPPGSAFIVAGNVALTTVADISLTWEETPQVGGV